MRNFVTEQMCDALKELQSVKSFDFSRADGLVFSGITAVGDPREGSPMSDITQDWIYGRILAARVYRDRQFATIAMR